MMAGMLGALLHHEVLEFSEVDFLVIVLVNVFAEEVDLIVSQLHLTLDLLEVLAEFLDQHEAFAGGIETAEDLFVAGLLILVLQARA